MAIDVAGTALVLERASNGLRVLIEQYGGHGGYVLISSAGGKVKRRYYHANGSAVTSLAGVSGWFAAVGKADAELYLYSAACAQWLTTPIAIDSAPYM